MFGCGYAADLSWYFNMEPDQKEPFFTRESERPHQIMPLTLKENQVEQDVLDVSERCTSLKNLLMRKWDVKSTYIKRWLHDVHENLRLRVKMHKHNHTRSILAHHLRELMPHTEE